MSARPSTAPPKAWASRSCARAWRTSAIPTSPRSGSAAICSPTAPRPRSRSTDGPPVRFNTAALYQLRKAIEGTGVGPENFVWPPADDPRRAPYRGWEPFEDIDAGVFFGRDAAIVQGLDELRAMRLLWPVSAKVAVRGAGPVGQRQVVVSAGRVDPAAAARGPPLSGAGHHAPAAQRADRDHGSGRRHPHRAPGAEAARRPAG